MRQSLNTSTKHIIKKNFIILTLGTLVISANMATAQNQDERVKLLENQINAMKAQLDQVKGGNSKPDWLGQAAEAQRGLMFNFYGEMKWINKEGSDKFDPHRFVLIPSYRLSDRATFLSEIELEHGGVDDTDGGRFDGELELEQFYIDYEVNDWATWRSLGISLIPVGTVNQYHEPDQFYSVHRPVMYKYIVPSTWFEPGTGFHGDIPSIDGLKYDFYVSSGLTSETGVSETDGGWAPRSTRPGYRTADGNDGFAYSGKLTYANGGFSGSVSTYQTTYKNGLGAKTDLGLYDIEASYQFANGLELIADYAFWNVGTPSVLTRGAGNTKTGDTMDGYRLEAAYHMPHGKNELVPFFRAEGYDLQSGALGASYNYLTYGAMYKFGDNWEIKAGARQSLDDNSRTEYTLGVGIQF